MMTVNLLPMFYNELLCSKQLTTHDITQKPLRRAGKCFLERYKSSECYSSSEIYPERKSLKALLAEEFVLCYSVGTLLTGEFYPPSARAFRQRESRRFRRKKVGFENRVSEGDKVEVAEG